MLRRWGAVVIVTRLYRSQSLAGACGVNKTQPYCLLCCSVKQGPGFRLPTRAVTPTIFLLRCCRALH
eukprot:44144-Eustigmatos_ZCMA.PRE.1